MKCDQQTLVLGATNHKDRLLEVFYAMLPHSACMSHITDCHGKKSLPYTYNVRRWCL